MPVHTFTSPQGEEYEVNGPEGSTREQAFSILQEGIKSGYYKPKSKKKALIPGEQSDEEKQAVSKQYDAQKQKEITAAGGKLNYGLKGFGEAALNVASQIPAQVVGVAGLGLHGLGKMLGVYPKDESSTQAASNLMNKMIYEPRSTVGQDYTNTTGEFVNRYLMPFGPGGQVAGLTKNQRLAMQDKYGKPTKPVLSVADAEAKLTPKPVAEVTSQPPITVAKNGDAYVSDPVVELARQRAAELQQKAQRRVSDVAPEIVEGQRNLNALAQAEKLKPVEPEVINRGDLTEQMALPLTDDPVAGMAKRNIEAAPEQLDLFEHKQPDLPDPRAVRQQQMDFMHEQRPMTDEFYQQRQAQELQKQQELDYQAGLEQKLREEAYTPDLQGQGQKTRTAQEAANPGFRNSSQRGAIHPQVFEDIYKFGKSVVRGTDGNLMPLYHGSGEVFDNIRSSTEGGALGNGVYLAVRPEYASGYAEGRAPNMHQVYANITKPLEIKGPGDPMVNALVSLGKTKEQAIKMVEKAYDEKGYITNEVRNLARKQGYDGIFQYRGDKLSEIVAFDAAQVKNAISGDSKPAKINKFGQGGSAPMLNDIADGIVKGVKAVFTGEKTVEPSTIIKPTTAEDIATKQKFSAKANAIGAKGSVYSAPATIEEVRANPGKDITSVAQDLTPGSYAVLRKNKNNKLLSFANRLFTEARLGKMKDSVAMITGKDGLIPLAQKLTSEEKQSVHNLAIAMDRKGLEWTPEMGDQFGFTQPMKDFMTKRLEVFDAVGNLADGTLGKLGMKLLNRRTGYAPANFDSKYTSLVVRVKRGDDGKPAFSVVGVLNAKSDWEHSQATSWARDKFAKELAEGSYQIIQKERKGLNQETSRFKQMDDSSRMMSLLAEHVPEVADLKGELDAFIENQTRNLYSHNVHELHKKGVFGSIGDRPWLDAKRNAEDFFRGEVNHIENALSYWHYQDAVATTRKAVADESIVGMDKTKSYLNRYLDSNFQGGLNGAGVLTNSLVDAAYHGMQIAVRETNKAVGAKKGWSPNDNPVDHLGNMRDVASAWMMGWINPAFTAIQVTQLATGALPEMLRIRSEFGLPPTKVAGAISNSALSATIMGTMDKIGKLDNLVPGEHVPAHMLEAYKWAKERGITVYNEIEQSHSLEHPVWTTVKHAATLPSRMGETMSTPPAFLAIVDMLHESGKRGEELHLAAYDALKYAMTEYHSDAAPLLHTRSGIAGRTIGGLKKYVHNAVDQQISRTLEAKDHPAAFGAAWGSFLFFAGTSGLLGYNLANSLSMAATNQGLEQHWNNMFGKGIHSQGVLHGYASALSGWDLQTRYSMADAIPSNPVEAAAGPHLTRLAQTVAAGVAYAKNRDDASFLDLAKTLVPAGPGIGMLDQAVNVDEQGNVLDKEGQRKYPDDYKRTPAEQLVRKSTGIRPLRERMFDEQNYTNTLLDQKKSKARSDATKSMHAAMYREDEEGFKRALDKYLANEGNVEQLPKMITKYVSEKNLDSRQRKAGIAPKKNTIDRWERYNQ